MANVDAPFGLKPVRHYKGGLVRANEYRIPSAYATGLFTGDPLILSGTSKEVNIATATSALLGVFAGCQYEDAQGNVVYSRYWPASQATKTGSVRRCWVWDDPGILFMVQADGAVAEADIGAVANLISGSGSTVTGTSAWELDSSDIAGSGAGPVKIVDYVRDDDNAVDTNARLLVLFNEHIFDADSAGV